MSYEVEKLRNEIRDMKYKIDLLENELKNRIREAKDTAEKASQVAQNVDYKIEQMLTALRQV